VPASFRETPRVSVGLPVYNGENFLEEALESVLAQTVPAHEVIVSDNASTDRTREIAEDIAVRHPRIRYLRAERNRGAAWNYNEVFRQSRGEYFKWLAHDDKMAPDFLELTLSALERTSDAVLCCPRARIIDAIGNELEQYAAPPEMACSSAVVRFRSIVRGDELRWFESFALIRSSALRRTRLIGRHALGNRVLLAELALSGSFSYLPEPLHVSRRHALQSVSSLRSQCERTCWFDTSREGTRVRPNWEALREYQQAVSRSSLGPWDTAQCHGVILGFGLGRLGSLLEETRRRD